MGSKLQQVAVALGFGGGLLFSSGITCAKVVLEANFSGSGTGTGAGNMVQSGGTGMWGATGPKASVSIATNNPFTPVSGGYLGIKIGPHAIAGIKISPNSASTSFNSWVNTTKNTVNGAFDLFFQPSLASTSWGMGDARLLHVNSSNANVNGALQLVLTDAVVSGAEHMQLALYEGTGSGSKPLAAPITTSATYFAANTVYHIAGTFTTDTSTGHVTAHLYIAKGTGAIDITNSSTYEYSVSGTNSAIGAALANDAFSYASGFIVGHPDAWAIPAAMGLNVDTFRIYNNVPTTFAGLPSAAVPAPASLGLVALGSVGLLLLSRRRKTV